MYHHRFERGFMGGPFMGGPFMVRRRGFPLLPIGGIGGYGLVGGMGTLLDSVMAGGLGYLVGRNARSSAQQQYQQQYPQYQQPYPPQYQQQPAQQYQQPYQAPANSPADNRIAQLRQLGQLRESGVLTDEEFQAEKQRILNGM